MPRTLGQLATEVRQHLAETTAQFWTDAEIRTWIVEGSRDLARRAETLQSTKSIATLAGTQTYTAPTDMIRISRVEWTPSGTTNIYPLEGRMPNEMDVVWGIYQAQTSAYPSFYIPWGYPPSVNLILYPVPSTAGSLTVWYFRLPADLATDGTADNTNVDVPEGWWDVLNLFAEYMALRKDADPRWVDTKKLYDERLGDHIDQSRRWMDAVGYITANTTFVPSWLYSPDGAYGG